MTGRFFSEDSLRFNFEHYAGQLDKAYSNLIQDDSSDSTLAYAISRRRHLKRNIKSLDLYEEVSGEQQLDSRDQILLIHKQNLERMYAAEDRIDELVYLCEF